MLTLPTQAKKTLLVFLPLILISILLSSAQAERLPLKTYSVADGLSHNQINKIARDSRGFLWFCTADGLSRFDGYTFTNLGTDQGLPGPSVMDFLETAEGSFWVATNRGLVRFDPRGRQTRTVIYVTEAAQSSPMFAMVAPDSHGSESLAINVLLEDPSGVVWCGTNRGLYGLVRSGDTYTLSAVDIGLPMLYPEQSNILALLEDRRGSLWIAAPSGLYRREPGGATRHYTMGDGLPEEYIQTLFADDQGRLWAGTRSTGFFQFASGANGGPLQIPRVYGIREGLPTGWIFQLCETSDHQFWIATNAGLIEFDPDNSDRQRVFRAYGPKNGLSYHEITALSEDLGGNLWLGTSTAGAMKLSRNGFITYDSLDGIATTNAILEDQAGGLCFRAALVRNQSHSADKEGRPDLGAKVVSTNGRQRADRTGSLAREALEAAREVFQRAQVVSYEHPHKPAAEQVGRTDGRWVAQTDCSGFVSYVLNKVAQTPQYSAVMDFARRQYREDQERNNKTPRPDRPYYPDAREYADFFGSLSTRTPSSGWIGVASVWDLRRGDFIAWAKENWDGKGNSGHVAIVIDPPSREVLEMTVPMKNHEGLVHDVRIKYVTIRVLDSSSVSHFGQEQLPPSVSPRQQQRDGVGIGDIRLVLDRDGTPNHYWEGYYWGEGQREIKSPGKSTDIHFGRLVD